MSTLGVLLVPLSIIILLPFVLALIFYKYARRFMWFIPFIVLIIMGGLFLNDVTSFGNVSALDDKLYHYFNSDASLNLYLLYVPTIISSLVFTLASYIIAFFKKKKPYKE